MERRANANTATNNPSRLYCIDLKINISLSPLTSHVNSQIIDTAVAAPRVCLLLLLPVSNP